MIDFLGKIDGEPFEGGAAEQQAVVIGAGRFIPGFEDQLVGVKAGDETEISVTFPEDYGASHLAGKDAVFEVKVHEIRAPEAPEINDDFAKGLGVEEGLEGLKSMFRDQIGGEYTSYSRQKAKRALLDTLDEVHVFDLPEKMVEQEFNQIWTQFQQEKEKGNLAEEDADKPEDELKEEYRKIAARRVRLGLVLAEIGRLNDIKIPENEVQQAVFNEARRYPGQEQKVVEMIQQNPNAMANIRAPIYEEKVVDFILENADVTDKTVSKDELFADDEVDI